MPCAALYGGVKGEFGLLEMLEVLEMMRCVLLCMPEAVEPYLQEVLEALDVLDVLDVASVMRCRLLCMLEAVEDRLGLLEMLEVIRCVLSTIYAEGCGGWALFARGVGGVEGDAPCATSNAGSCGGWALFAGGARGDALRAVLYAEVCGG